jgi:hypothetical protein
MLGAVPGIIFAVHWYSDYVGEGNMHRSIFRSRVNENIKTHEVEEHTETRQGGFIVILLMLAILLFVLTPVGCSTLLALLAGTGAAVAP